MVAQRKPCYGQEELKLLWNVLRDNVSLPPIRALLKERNLPYSAPGEALFRDQILPALLPPPSQATEPVETTEGAEEVQEAGSKVPTLEEQDLIQLLRDHEEYGSQHVFLYECDAKRARQLLSEQRVRQELAARQLAGLLECPRVLDKPLEPTLVDVRFENTDAPKSFTLKAVEKRIYQVQERPDPFTVIVRQEEERAVNVMRLHASGLLELRIAAFRSGGSYNTAQATLWGLAGDVLPMADFAPVDLVPLRRSLWQRRNRLLGRLRFRTVRVRTPKGTVVTFATGEPDDNLAQDKAAVDAIEEILKSGGAIDEINAYWLALDALRLDRDVHMLLSGQLNELVILGRCSKADHSYVLDRVEAYRR